MDKSFAMTRFPLLLPIPCPLGPLQELASTASRGIPDAVPEIPVRRRHLPRRVQQRGDVSHARSDTDEKSCRVDTGSVGDRPFSLELRRWANLLSLSADALETGSMIGIRRPARTPSRETRGKVDDYVDFRVHK